MKKQRGFVLPTVLLFIQIYALLGIGALEQVFLEQKMISDQKSRRLLLNEAERRLSRLAGSIRDVAPICQAPERPLTRLPGRPRSWWSAYSCTETSSLYRSYYIVENLGGDPCAQIRGENQGQAVYYRLTLLLTPEGDDSQRVLLQATVVSANQAGEHCDSQPHSVDLGPQAWHELLE